MTHAKRQTIYINIDNDIHIHKITKTIPHKKKYTNTKKINKKSMYSNMDNHTLCIIIWHCMFVLCIIWYFVFHCVSACLCVFNIVCLNLSSCICMSLCVYLSMYHFACVSIYVSLGLSLYVSLCLSFCLVLCVSSRVIVHSSLCFLCA